VTASDCRSPAMAFSPWGKMPLATTEVPIAPAPVLGGSRSCALVSNPLGDRRYEANSSEGSSEACAEKTSIRSAKS
jgi:hypothetical protein